MAHLAYFYSSISSRSKIGQSDDLDELKKKVLDYERTHSHVPSDKKQEFEHGINERGIYRIQYGPAHYIIDPDDDEDI